MAELEEGVEGERDGEDGPGEKADEQDRKIVPERALVVVLRGQETQDVLVDEEKPGELRIL